MNVIHILLLLVMSLPGFVHALVINENGSYDYAYQMYGSSRTLPLLVFDDGKYTYLEVSGGLHGKLTVRHSGSHEISINNGVQSDGFVRLPGTFPSFHVRGQGLNAEIAYIGTDKRSLVRLVETPLEPPVARSPILPVPASLVPPLIESNPDFSGSFVVRFMTTLLSDATKVTDNRKNSVANGAPSVTTKIMQVRFGGDAVIASRSDKTKIRAAARAAVKSDFLAIRAYSGAVTAESRQKYIAKRAEKVKKALIEAGVPEDKIRIVYDSSVRSAPKAEIEFISSISSSARVSA